MVFKNGFEYQAFFLDRIYRIYLISILHFQFPDETERIINNPVNPV